MFKPIFTLTSEVCLPISSLFGSYFIGNLRLSSSISIFLAIADVWVKHELVRYRGKINGVSLSYSTPFAHATSSQKPLLIYYVFVSAVVLPTTLDSLVLVPLLICSSPSLNHLDDVLQGQCTYRWWLSVWWFSQNCLYSFISWTSSCSHWLSTSSYISDITVEIRGPVENLYRKQFVIF